MNQQNLTTLEGLLHKLEVDKGAQDAAQIDKNLADIRKLKADKDKVLPEYEKAHGGATGLKAVQDDLVRRRTEVKERLERDLGEAGIEDVTDTVRRAVKNIDDLQKVVTVAETELANAATCLFTAETDLAENTAKLDRWRKPTAVITARQKEAVALATEVETLATPGVHESRQAYFLLGEGFAPADPDALSEGEKALLAARRSLENVVDAPPPVVDPHELPALIVEAWKSFTEARTSFEKAKQNMADRAAKVKMTKDALAAAEKSLIDDIYTALAGWSHPAVETSGEKEKEDA